MKRGKYQLLGRTFTLYRLVNRVNGKAYIGITSRSLHLRRIEHISDAMCNKSDLPIHRAIRKYGKEAFEMEELGTAETWEDLCQMEIDEIAKHKADRKLYNASWGGEGALGIDRTYAKGDNNWRRRTPEGKAHLTGDKSHMRRPEHRERMRLFNPAQRPGVMDCVKGDMNPAKRPEVRVKLKANNAFNDPERRDEVRRKLSISKMGKPNEKIRGANNGRAKPEERMRISGNGNPNAKSVIVHGVLYGTLMAAAKENGLPSGTAVKKLIEQGAPGYSWAESRYAGRPNDQ